MGAQPTLGAVDGEGHREEKEESRDHPADYYNDDDGIEWISALLQKPLDRGKGKKLVQDAPGRYQPRPCLLYFLSLCFCTFLLHKYDNTSESKGRKETKNMSFNSGLLYFYSFLNSNHEHLLNE